MMTKQLIIIAALMVATLLPGKAQDDEIKAGKHKTINEFDIDLGMNNYLQNGKFPDSDNAAYSIQPFGSWYIALKTTNHTPVAGPLYLLWGVDVSWYNFKFQDPNLRINGDDSGLSFTTVSNDMESKKSKLTAAYLNVSMVPMLKFGKANERKCNWSLRDYDSGFRIGAGAYGGYKIGSYTKVVTEERGDKKKGKDHDDFYLNNIRYGLRFQAGYRGMDVFVNYDLNELFTAGKGPELHAFSFGVVL